MNVGRYCNVALYCLNINLWNMKRILFFAFALFFCMGIYAQDNRRSMQMGAPREINPEEMALKQTEELNKVVALDSIQFQAVFLMNYADITAMQDSMKTRRPRIKDGDGVQNNPKRPTDEEREARRKAFQEHRDARNARMKEILNEEQYEKYLTYMSQKNERRRGMERHGGRR